MELKLGLLQSVDWPLVRLHNIDEMLDKMVVHTVVEVGMDSMADVEVHSIVCSMRPDSVNPIRRIHPRQHRAEKPGELKDIHNHKRMLGDCEHNIARRPLESVPYEDDDASVSVDEHTPRLA